MTETKRLESMIGAHWGSALRMLHAAEAKRGSEMEFDASVNELARHLLEIPGNTTTGIINRLTAGTMVNTKILTMYISILSGMDALPEVKMLPTGAFLLQIPGCNIVIGPETAVQDVQNVHAALYTTPTRSKDNLPQLAEFTGEANIGEGRVTFTDRLSVNGLTIERTDFRCDVFADGISLGRVDLSEAYAEQVSVIDDRHTYMEAWDIHINDYLHHVQDVIKNARVLLDMERQYNFHSEEQDPKIINHNPFRRIFLSLADITRVSTNAFFSPLLKDTLEDKFVGTQIAKINNVMMAPLLVVDSRSDRLKQSLIAEAISALESLFDPADHLRMTYEVANKRRNVKLDVEDSNASRMELDNPIAVRRLLDAIVYQAILHQTEDTSKLSFKLDEPNRVIDVSYEMFQPESLVDALHKVATRYSFTGAIDFQWSNNKISGLRIMDQAPKGSTGEGLGNNDIRGGSTPTIPPKALNMPYGRTAPVLAMMLGAQAMVGV